VTVDVLFSFDEPVKATLKSFSHFRRFYIHVSKKNSRPEKYIDVTMFLQKTDKNSSTVVPAY